MIRIVHLFDVKKGVEENSFMEWLDAKLEVAARRFGCVDRKTWVLLDGFTGNYLQPYGNVRDRPKYVNEAYWDDLDGAKRFREWLVSTPEGREIHDRWFGSIQNHTVLRYVEGWARHPSDE
ncbi:MAG TPA: hypothetical protein VFX98_08505 [Longimicrobiaceae bacterium]|nr:hypothetical protein [Longimicrobiaceae bacterium]